jgi:nitrite reductase/ring-hydroxylating ferredoxin subunit/uncharacterized membrane protein
MPISERMLTFASDVRSALPSLIPSAERIRSVLPDPARPGRVLSTVDALEHSTALDPVIRPLRRAVHAVPMGGARDVLHGRWLGHPLHPALVQLPIGSWLSAAVLDLVPGSGHRRAAGLLVGTGLAGAVPAAVSGWTDWAEMRPAQARVGLVHALANSAAVGLYGASLVCRLRGRRLRGRAYGYAGITTVLAGGLLGGHLAYRQSAAVNHAESVPAVSDGDWHLVGEVAQFAVGEPARRMVGEVPVVVVRGSGGEVHVLADRCSHMAGPLSGGTLIDGCVQCPWHGSVFRLSDGWNVSGPATSPQPVYETRLVDGRVEARLPS